MKFDISCTASGWTPGKENRVRSCRANPQGTAESHASEIFAGEFVMLSRKIQKPQAGNPPSPWDPVTPAVPVSISVRWSIAILALSPPLALLSIPDRLSLWLVLPSLPLVNPSPRFLSDVRASLYRDFQYHAHMENEGGIPDERDGSLLQRWFSLLTSCYFFSILWLYTSWNEKFEKTKISGKISFKEFNLDNAAKQS